MCGVFFSGILTQYESSERGLVALLQNYILWIQISIGVCTLKESLKNKTNSISCSPLASLLWYVMEIDL